MTKQYKKICLVMLVALFTYSFAASSFKTKFVGITKAIINNDDGNSFNTGGNNLDELGIEMQATIDNVTGFVKVAKETVDDVNGVLKFDSAYLEVKDVLDGLLAFKFYDIGYAAGKGHVARADLGAHGVKVTVKPIDLLSIAIGYGINNDQLRNDDTVEDGVTFLSELDAADNTFNGDYHAVTLDVGVNLDILPFTIYVGAVLADRNSQRVYDMPVAVTTAAPNGILQVRSKASKLMLVQAGLTMDALAAVKPGALKIDFGAAFAGSQTTDFMATSNKIATGTTTNDIEMERALAMAVILHGGVSDLAPGFGLDYYFHFSPDSMTKYETLGDLDDDVFAELIKVSLTPNYTLGQFKFALGIGFKRYGENASRYFKQITGANGANASVNILEVDPSITWSPATGMSAKFFYELDMTLSGDSLYAVATSTESLNTSKDAIDHTIGMKVELALTVASE